MKAPGTTIVLVMHGEPPRDFPREELARFFRLQAELMTAHPDLRPRLRAAYAELEHRLRTWPRTADNDPFFAGAHALARELAKQTGCPVVVGFNEFCAPTVDESIDRAVHEGARRVVVVTPMMTPGGRHSEVDIPTIVRRASHRHPSVPIVYGWPFPLNRVAALLADQVRHALDSGQAALWEPAPS